MATIAGAAHEYAIPKDALSQAYWRILDERSCAIIELPKQRFSIFEELDRTDLILLGAGEKGLAKRLEEAAKAWREFDAIADKICDFQRPGWKGSAVDSLRTANDMLERAVRESAKE